MFISLKVWKHTSDGARDFIDKLLQVDPEKRPKATEARKDQWVNSIPPLTGHKGNSFKYLSSQVSGKSGKTNVSYPSPVIKEGKVEEEIVPQVSKDKDEKLQIPRKEVATDKDVTSVDLIGKKLEDNPSALGIDNSGVFKDETIRSELDAHLKAGRLAPIPKDKPESTVTSYQEEFPSAAATEDSNSFASRAENSPGIEGEFVEQEFPPVSPQYEVNEMKKSLAGKHGVDHFGDDARVCDDWVVKQDGGLTKGNLLDLRLQDGKGKTWQNPHRGELNMMFGPLQKNKLKWYMQEKTSVMEKVGMWLEEQNGYSKDDRLSNSHGDIDRIDKTIAQGHAQFDSALVKYSTISASSSPFKKSAVRKGTESVRLQQLGWPDISGQLVLESSDKDSYEIANKQSVDSEVDAHEREELRNGHVFTSKHEAFGRIQHEMKLSIEKDRREIKSMSELSKNFRDMTRGLGSYSIPGDDYSCNILLDESSSSR